MISLRQFHAEIVFVHTKERLFLSVHIRLPAFAVRRYDTEDLILPDRDISRNGIHIQLYVLQRIGLKRFDFLLISVHRNCIDLNVAEGVDSTQREGDRNRCHRFFGDAKICNKVLPAGCMVCIRLFVSDGFERTGRRFNRESCILDGIPEKLFLPDVSLVLL